MVLFSQNTYTQIIPEGKVHSISILLSSHKENSEWKNLWS